MTKIKETKINKLLDEYVNLNAKQKKDLQTAFNKEFDYSEKSSSFFRKLNNPDQVWSHEQKFFAEKFQTTTDELFPSSLIKF